MSGDVISGGRGCYVRRRSVGGRGWGILYVYQIPTSDSGVHNNNAMVAMP